MSTKIFCIQYPGLDEVDGTESNLDNGSRTQQDLRAKIMRRPGVSKTKGSPLRRAYRLNSEDKVALLASLPSQPVEETGEKLCVCMSVCINDITLLC